jgi:hypothetical protein
MKLPSKPEISFAVEYTVNLKLNCTLSVKKNLTYITFSYKTGPKK